MDELLRTAIAERWVVSFTLHRLPRGGKPLGWRRAAISEISDLRLLDQRFAGPRRTPSGRHLRWDTLFATVYRRE